MDDTWLMDEPLILGGFMAYVIVFYAVIGLFIAIHVACEDTKYEDNFGIFTMLLIIAFVIWPWHVYRRKIGRRKMWTKIKNSITNSGEV